MKQPTKQQRQALKRENNKWPAIMVPVRRDQWPGDGNDARVSVWRSCDFLAQVFMVDSGIRISINRSRYRHGTGWDDRITWDELQAIKRQIGFGDRWAYEVFPPDNDLVNVANMRHLWIPDDRPGFGWKHG